MTQRLSVVIPTYNRPEQLAQVLDCLVKSEIADVPSVEVIVVDDGSTAPIKETVELRQSNDRFLIRYLGQPNSGPAAARNTGFVAATGDIVLHIDDDILVFPTLLAKHVQAHKDNPGSVIFGQSPFPRPQPETSSYRYLATKLGHHHQEKYRQVEVVASGHLSVERRMFVPDGVYRGDLRTPAAEEFELEHRLNTKGIPIIFASEAIGWHLQPTTIEEKCRQEFKYGVGAAEVVRKMDNIQSNGHLAPFSEVNGYIDRRRDPIWLILKKISKSLLSSRLIRSIMVWLAGRLNCQGRLEPYAFRYYDFVCGIYLFAGYRKGLKEFSTQEEQYSE